MNKNVYIPVLRFQFDRNEYFAMTPISISHRTICQRLNCFCWDYLCVVIIYLTFSSPGMARSFVLFREAHHRLGPFLQLKEKLSTIIFHVGYVYLKKNAKFHWSNNSACKYMNTKINITPVRILMFKFSRINANNVVVNVTFFSSSSGIFIRISFL